MAQDFGDDTGEMLIRVLENHIRDAMRFRRPHSHHNKKSAEDKKDQQPIIYLPLSNWKTGEILSQICKDNGVTTQIHQDPAGNEYLEFKESDLPKLNQAIKQMAETMTADEEQKYAQKLDTVPPVTEETRQKLTPVQPDPASLSENRTASICEKVKQAREECTDFAEFEKLLNQQGIGLTETRAGEVMFYEARFSRQGNVLPFGRDENGRRDWAVGADTLKTKWGVDATHDWFGQNTPKEAHALPGSDPSKIDVRATDGSLDQDGSTPDLNQGIDSHDGIDTDVSTLRIEREQNATDVSPSTVRRESEKSRTYNLASESGHKREASKQLASRTGIRDRSQGLSDKMKPVR